MNKPPDLNVVHSPKHNRFEVVVGELRSQLDYRRADRTMTITHTFVPPDLRGRGIAEALMKAAIAFAQAEKLAIDPACSYAARYLERHPPPA